MDNFTLKLDFKSKEPLYEQLYHFIITEIKEGNLKENERLPSKKRLCSHLKISQSTVETTYESLVAEGYVRAVARSGYYVCALELLEKKNPLAPINLPEEKPSVSYLYDFSTSAVDTSVFPYASWAKLTKEIVYQNPELLLRGDKQGDLCLREVLSKFLHEYRGVQCLPSQLIIGAGIEYLLGEDAVFALENPGYETTYRTIENNNRRIVPIPLDSSGLCINELENSGANIAYVTPSHQFPMGITMPVGRRAKLIKWANAAPNRYLIEDDYDSEFRFSTRPIPAMQGLDENGKVIYIGTFSRSIAPSIRIAYMVLPLELLNLYRDKFNYSSSTVSRFEQQILFQFLKKGLYTRHLGRMGNLYKQRRNFFIEQLMHLPFSQKIRIQGSEAGLHFLLEIINGQNEKELIESAKVVGIKVHGLSQYYHRDKETCPTSTLVLGYAGLSLQEIEGAIQLLSSVWSKKVHPYISF